MPRHPTVNPALRQPSYHPYTTQPLKTLRVTTIAQCTAKSVIITATAAEPSPEMLEPRPSHYAPLRSYSPQPEFYSVDVAYDGDDYRCASTSRMTLEIMQHHNGIWSPSCTSDQHIDSSSPHNHSHSSYCAAPPPHTISIVPDSTSTSSPVISHPVYYHQKHQPPSATGATACHAAAVQQLSPVDLVSPVSASPYDPIADDYPMQQEDCSESQTAADPAGEEASDANEQESEPVLHQPKPRRRIPILSLADLADTWQIDEHGREAAIDTTQQIQTCRPSYP